MLTHSEIGNLTVPGQLFGYAYAYRTSSAVLCEKFESDDAASSTWPNATVLLMLAAHAVELFLKGALLKRNVQEEEVWSFGHKINFARCEIRGNLSWRTSVRMGYPICVYSHR